MPKEMDDADDSKSSDPSQSARGTDTGESRNERVLGFLDLVESNKPASSKFQDDWSLRSSQDGSSSADKFSKGDQLATTSWLPRLSIDQDTRKSATPEIAKSHQDKISTVDGMLLGLALKGLIDEGGEKQRDILKLGFQAKHLLAAAGSGVSDDKTMEQAIAKLTQAMLIDGKMAWKSLGFIKSSAGGSDGDGGFSFALFSAWKDYHLAKNSSNPSQFLEERKETRRTISEHFDNAIKEFGWVPGFRSESKSEKAIEHLRKALALDPFEARQRLEMIARRDGNSGINNYLAQAYNKAVK